MFWRWRVVLPRVSRHRARRIRMYTLLALLALVLLLVTPLYLVYWPPVWLISLAQRAWPDVLWRVQLPSDAAVSLLTTAGDRTLGTTTKKVVALSLDDAPSEFTREIAGLLTVHGAHATFFVIGGQVVQGREAVLQALVRGGHELGNHAMHDEASVSLKPQILEDEIRQVEATIARVYESVHEADETSSSSSTTSPPKFFRPGGGFFNARLRQQVARLGYRLVLGNVYPHDPQIPFWRVNARHILGMVRPGSIIICHDRRSWTLPMLRKVLPALKARGYEIVTISKLLEEQRQP